MKRWLWVAAVVSTYACHGGETEPQQAPSASSSSSAAAELDPVDAYCGAIESEWRSVDSQCTSEQRAMPEHAQARAAVTAAVAKCRALLAASHAAGRIAFEPKVIVNHDYTCSAAVKYEWAVLAPLTRLQSNCSRTRLAGLVSERSPCSYSFECRSHVCNAGSCSKPLAEGESCASVEPTVLDRATPCAEGLYCDQVPAAPLIAGYPPPSGKSARADFPIRPGRVVVEPVREGSGPTRDISKWAAEIRPYLVRCFEAALARDAKTRGALTLDVPLEGSPAVVVSEVPDLLRDCAAEIVHWRSPDPAARIRI